MSETHAFGTAYADYYDALYSDKDYERECDLIEQAFARWDGAGTVRSILDAGCGTGNYALPLARRGYQVTGLDLSPAMLQIAARKAAEARLAIPWVHGDLRTAWAGGPFDAVICMFAALGYLVESQGVQAALSNLRRHLRPAALLLFDVWHGPAVLTIRPSERVKLVALPDGGRLVRATSGRLDTRLHCCDVRYHLRHLMDDRLLSEATEVHRVRYFFPAEVKLLLELTGFELISLTAFPTLDQPADETTWNILVAARASGTSGDGAAEHA